MRLGYRTAYRILQAWTFARRPQVRGSMVAVLDEDRVLLVRHTYGRREVWDLPGGWVQAGEDPAVAARREVAEELGIDVSVAPVAVIALEVDFKREQLSAFRADWPGGRGRYDPVEIAEVGWFALDAPPARISGGARAVLERLRAS